MSLKEIKLLKAQIKQLEGYVAELLKEVNRLMNELARKKK